MERARGADQYLEPKKEEPKKEEPKKEEEKPEEKKPEEEEKKEAPPADPTGRGAPRGPPTGPPGRGAPRGPPGRGDPRGPPTGPPGRGPPAGPAGPADGRGVAVPLAPTARGRGPAGPAGRGPAGRGPAGRGGRGPAAKAEIRPTKPVIKLKSKMKPFFWKRVILPPDAPKTLIWKNIKEEPINQDEIEALYTDAKANAPVKEGEVGSVKVRGPSKRTFFSGEEN